MKLSLKWLSDYVNSGLAPEKLAERLTMSGQEVKAIEDVQGDKVFEIEVTPNRPDCLNVIGLARETAAITGKNLKYPKDNVLKIPKASVDITIEDKEGCGRYVGALVENVNIGASPAFLKERLNAIGLRLINNAVDVTNFVLFESGQPLHAFDYDKLIGGKIIVRRARAGEKIMMIDGVERQLNPTILVIADAKRPVAIAGVMGGVETEVTAKTKRILLESAYFDPILIRRAARSLGLSSDSSYRFERGVNFSGVDASAKRAIQLILETAGGTAQGYRDVSIKKISTKPKITVNLKKIDHFLGSAISSTQAKKILTQLEFKVSTKGKYSLVLIPPDFRNDIKADVDIAEELARIIGYDRIPSSLPQIKPSAISSSPKYILKRRLTSILTGQGVDECISYPLVSRAAIDRSLVSEKDLVKVRNPLSLDQEFLRPSLLPSLFNVILLNFNRGQKDLRLFEIGKAYLPDGEREVLAVILSGSRLRDWRDTQKRPVDLYDLKGIIVRALEGIDLAAPEFVPVSSRTFAQGQAAQIVVGRDKFGVLGKVSKAVLKNWDIKTDDLFYAEIDIALLQKNKISLKHFKPLPEFPSITRDVSVAVNKDVPFSQIETIARRFGGEFLVGFHFLEQYLGEKIPVGQKGLVFSLIYQSSDRTLTEKEIAPTHEKILKALTSELGAAIR